MKVVGYSRVSGKSQVDGDGFPRQFEAIQKFCAANALTLGRVFREEGVSGSVDCMDRPAFFEMLSVLEKGDAVVCERMDRLARDLTISEILVKECRERGISVYAADRGCLVDMASDGADPTVRMIRQILASVAEFDKNSLVRKLRAARDRIRERTGRCEGSVPYGETESQARVLLLIGGMIADGNSFRHIARFLNESGFPSRWGKKWTHWTIKRIWDNPKRKNKKP